MHVGQCLCCCQQCRQPEKTICIRKHLIVNLFLQPEKPNIDISNDVENYVYAGMVVEDDH